MKWFFLSLLAPFALVGEALIVKPTLHSAPYIPVDRVPGAVAYLVFCLSLFVYWWSSYLSPADRRERGWQMGHALVMLSLGIYLGLLGMSFVLSGTCKYVRPAGGRSEWSAVIEALTGDVAEHGLCIQLGYLCLALGAGLTWPTYRFFAARTGPK